MARGVGIFVSPWHVLRDQIVKVSPVGIPKSVEALRGLQVGVIPARQRDIYGEGLGRGRRRWRTPGGGRAPAR